MNLKAEKIMFRYASVHNFATVFISCRGNAFSGALSHARHVVSHAACDAVENAPWGHDGRASWNHDASCVRQNAASDDGNADRNGDQSLRRRHHLRRRRNILEREV